MPDTDGAATAQTSGTEQPTDEGNLGAGGQKALEAERKARRDAERQLREAQDRIRVLETADVRREVAAAKNLSPAQAKRLQGSNREELEADADDLVAAFRPPDVGDVNRRPAERLRPGAVPAAEPPESPAQIADRVLERGI